MRVILAMWGVIGIILAIALVIIAILSAANIWYFMWMICLALCIIVEVVRGNYFNG